MRGRKISKNVIQKFYRLFKSSCVASFGDRISNNAIHLSSGALFNNQKQFGFGEGHPTSYTLVNLFRGIYKSFKQNKFIMGALIDVGKDFDTV